MKIYPKMNKSNTALLVIDVVNSCAHEKCESPAINIHFSKIREMIPKLSGFIDSYRKEEGSCVIFANITPWDKEHLPENIQELYTDPNVVYYSDNKSGFPEEFYQVKPEKDDLVITKNTYDAFTGTGLAKTLRNRGIQYLVVTGIFTEGCVLSTICNGFSAGFNFVILKDLIETADSAERQEISRLLKNRVFPFLYGQTITSEEFSNSWVK
ncbi:MAG: isochorismatase family cysteine hydrolase [Patescibacteria group bacterium]|jgi:nicotinamidase-related amidase